MRSELRACVIGCLSEWYQRVHHPSLVRLGGRVRLAAGSYLSGERGDDITGALGFDRAYADADEMLEREKPDFVFVCVNPAVAAEVAVRVLARRIPLVMEKPVGTGPEQGRRVLEAAERAGAPNMVLWNRRHCPLLVRARRLAEERGGVSQYTGEWLRHDVRAPRAMLGSSAHMIDALRFLGGGVRSFSGVGSGARYFDDAMVAASFHLMFGSGAAGTFTVNMRAGRAHEVYRLMAENWTATVSLPLPGVHDERWWMEVESGGELVERVSMGDLAGEQNCAGYAQGFWAESEHFVESLRTGIEPSPSIAESVESMELAESMQRAVAPPGQVPG